MTNLPNLLSDTGDNPAVGSAESADRLAALRNEPATKGWALDILRETVSKCWARRQLRRMNLWIAFGLGVVLAGQALGWLALKGIVQEVAEASAVKVLRAQGIRVVDQPAQSVGLIPSAHAEGRQ
jgi:hypothetical protein